ncbi:hypothetical protein CHS0354_012746 [Potamilus streckersoni]|uniref:Heat shock protein 70 n=1 Tax=Potamilus streckersoni TaxID=2493646 RepID=A0AAE0SYM1_9BIVA|nr:hypothetical protein CHS0354_012746 [Potamilus streckersoni]
MKIGEKCRAGIKDENLQIALEPETASIFCRLLPVEKLEKGSDFVCFPAGSKYMVLDAGGGTVDITVHEVMSGGQLKEIHKASGGAWGGTKVDEAFKQFIIGLVGMSVFQRFCEERKEDHLDLFRDFEIPKRGISSDTNVDINIRLPTALKEIYKENNCKDLSEAIKQSRYTEEVILVYDKLRVKASVIKNFFSNSIDNIISHVKELLNDSRVREISSIMMVGGFSESKMLQKAIKSSFPNINVFIPGDAGLVVLKGAVVFGHSLSSIAMRVSKFTYGINSLVPFDTKIHDIKKRRECDDGP